MALEPLAPLARLSSMSALSGAPAGVAVEAVAPTSGFAQLLQNIARQNQHAHAAADAAVRELATGHAQDLHTVALAVAKADLSFRLILELRNRLSDAVQEVLRMQV
jgi:flagellar hook-basal body complex protein FliE